MGSERLENPPAREMLEELNEIERPERTFAEYERRFRKKWNELSNSPDRMVDWNDFLLSLLTISPFIVYLSFGRRLTQSNLHLGKVRELLCGWRTYKVDL